MTRYKSQGFTFIEIVVVLILSVILSVYAFVSYPGLIVNVDAEAQQFANQVRYTQALSMSQAQRYYISQASTTSYQIFNSSGIAVPFANGSTTMKLNSGLTFHSWGNLSNKLVAFDSRGRPYLSTGPSGAALANGTDYSIKVTGGGRTKTISVTPATGMITVA